MKELQSRAEAARAHFESARDRLYRGDGEPIYAEAEMKERIRELRSQRNQELDAIEQEAEAKRQQANNEAEALQNGGLSAWLTGEELERAGARHAIIAAEVAALNSKELQERINAVTASADRPTRACYWLAARGKLSAKPGAFLSELREALIPDTHRRKLQEAQGSLRQAGEVRTICKLARREQNSAYVPNYAVQRS